MIETLHPWLDQMVIIDGWTQRLYRLHPPAQPLDYERWVHWTRISPCRRTCRQKGRVFDNGCSKTTLANS